MRKLIREKQGTKPEEVDEDEDDDLEDIDRISKEDAYLFPIFGSITLTGLFLAFKYLDKVRSGQCLCQRIICHILMQSVYIVSYTCSESLISYYRPTLLC